MKGMFNGSGGKVAEKEFDPVTEIVTAVVTGVKGFVYTDRFICSTSFMNDIPCFTH